MTSIGEAKGTHKDQLTVVGPAAFIKAQPRLLCNVWKAKGYCGRSYVASMCKAACARKAASRKPQKASKEDSGAFARCTNVRRGKPGRKRCPMGPWWKAFIRRPHSYVRPATW